MAEAAARESIRVAPAGSSGSFMRRNVMESWWLWWIISFAISIACVIWPISGEAMKISSTFSIFMLFARLDLDL